VNSPIAAVCFACHDSSADIAHFELNGGAIYAPRNTALNAIETCLICHGSGKIADIKVVHAQ
jgi:cytochrome c553